MSYVFRPVISFDFDSTLCVSEDSNDVGIMQCIELVKSYYSLGCRCIIITARIKSESNKDDIYNFIHMFDMYHMIEDIYFTDLKLKGVLCNQLQVSLHYDDCDIQIESVRSFGITCIDSKGI